MTWSHHWQQTQTKATVTPSASFRPTDSQARRASTFHTLPDPKPKTRDPRVPHHSRNSAATQNHDETEAPPPHKTFTQASTARWCGPERACAAAYFVPYQNQPSSTRMATSASTWAKTPHYRPKYNACDTRYVRTVLSNRRMTEFYLSGKTPPQNKQPIQHGAHVGRLIHGSLNESIKEKALGHQHDRGPFHHAGNIPCSPPGRPPCNITGQEERCAHLLPPSFPRADPEHGEGEAGPSPPSPLREEFSPPPLYCTIHRLHTVRLQKRGENH